MMGVMNGGGASPSDRATHEPSPAVSALRVGIPDADRCLVPPEGWWCSRGAGHDGPCAAHPDPVVGHKTLADGTHQPLYQKEAEALWEAAEAAKARRQEMMPDEQSAIRLLWDAQARLKELGWKDPIYAPKDGSPLDIIELGSTGIHRGHYEGKWPTGSWWVYDGDIYHSRPALARAAQGTEARQGGDGLSGSVHDGPVACDAPKGASHD